MQLSQQELSLIAEQQNIHIAKDHRLEANAPQMTYKYATVNEIKLFERASQLRNQQLIQNRPLLFSEDDFGPAVLHFINEKGRQTFSKDKKEVSSLGLLVSKQNSLTLQMPVSNIQRQNTLRLQLKNLKRRFPFQIQNVENERQKQQVRYKYILTLNDINLLIRVLVELNGEYKVWKQMEVPLVQSRFTLQITQFNNQQTDIKINQFLFHLLLKMPFHQQANYHILHNNKVQIEKIQFKSKSQKRMIDSNETYCSKECQLI